MRTISVALPSFTPPHNTTGPFVFCDQNCTRRKDWLTIRVDSSTSLLPATDPYNATTTPVISFLK